MAARDMPAARLPLAGAAAGVRIEAAAGAGTGRVPAAASAADAAGVAPAAERGMRAAARRTSARRRRGLAGGLSRSASLRECHVSKQQQATGLFVGSCGAVHTVKSAWTGGSFPAAIAESLICTGCAGAARVGAASCGSGRCARCRRLPRRAGGNAVPELRRSVQRWFPTDCQPGSGSSRRRSQQRRRCRPGRSCAGAGGGGAAAARGGAAPPGGAAGWHRRRDRRRRGGSRQQRRDSGKQWWRRCRRAAAAAGAHLGVPRAVLRGAAREARPAAAGVRSFQQRSRSLILQCKARLRRRRGG